MKTVCSNYNYTIWEIHRICCRTFFANAFVPWSVKWTIARQLIAANGSKFKNAWTSTEQHLKTVENSTNHFAEENCSCKAIRNGDPDAIQISQNKSQIGDTTSSRSCPSLRRTRLLHTASPLPESWNCRSRNVLSLATTWTDVELHDLCAFAAPGWDELCLTETALWRDGEPPPLSLGPTSRTRW